MSETRAIKRAGILEAIKQRLSSQTREHLITVRRTALLRLILPPPPFCLSFSHSLLKKKKKKFTRTEKAHSNLSTWEMSWETRNVATREKLPSPTRWRRRRFNLIVFRGQPLYRRQLLCAETEGPSTSSQSPPRMSAHTTGTFTPALWREATIFSFGVAVTFLPPGTSSLNMGMTR